MGHPITPERDLTASARPKNPVSRWRRRFHSFATGGPRLGELICRTTVNGLLIGIGWFGVVGLAVVGLRSRGKVEPPGISEYPVNRARPSRSRSLLTSGVS